MNTYDLNDGVTLTETVKDANGNLVDPQTLTLTYTDPTGIETTVQIGSLTHVSLGTYQYVIAPGKPGVWSYYWESTVPQGSSSGRFLVLAEPALGQTTFSLKLGALGWDAVAYVRALTEDTDQTSFTVPDATYSALADAVLDDYSRFRPRGDYVVGNIWNNTSPLVTAQGQTRYVCNPANGFTEEPDRITDVLYRAGTGYTVANDIGYFALLPFSPISAFTLGPDLFDNPSLRYVRDLRFNELEHYGRGVAGITRDPATGLLALDLYPTPQAAGLPIFVRYQVSHNATTDASGNKSYATVPRMDRVKVADLLRAAIMSEEAERFAKRSTVKGGMLERVASPAQIRAMAEDLKQTVYLQLGAAVSRARASS